MASLEGVLKLLAFYKRHDIARLLQRARLDFDVSDTYGSLLFSRLTTAEIYTPIEDCQKLRSLPSKDYEAILRSIRDIFPPRPYDMEINRIEFYVDPETPTKQGMTDAELIQEIEAQRNLMVAVATGGPRIDSVNAEYQERQERIEAALRARGLRNPNPYADLWAWYGKWSSGDLPTYLSRRQYISELYGPLLEGLRAGAAGRGAELFEEPTGWAKVDRGIGETRRRLEEAATEEQFQAVGLLCRETLISLAQVVYDPARHRPPDGVLPSAADAKRMLEAYLASELAGGANDEARRHARAALDLANQLQHKRTANFRDAALCAEATTAVVNLIAIISGRRDPD